MTRPDDRISPSHEISVGRQRVALALSLFALAAALVGAIGPAKHERTVYTWPPAELPTGTPSRAWYTPLLLIRHEPESISARIPCAVPQALPDASRPLTLLATARFPERYGGLLVARQDDELVVRIGKRTLDRVSIPERAARDPRCSYRLELANRRWSIEGPGTNEQAADLASMPLVSGLFSAIDLRTEKRLSIDVTTTIHGSEVTLRQTVAWTASVLAALTALLFVAIVRWRRDGWGALAARVRSVRMHLHRADAVVAGTLLAWWIIAPAFYDDGWVSARVRNFSASNGFSAYYNAFGGNLPLGYWPEWVQYWFADRSTTMLVERIPALICLAAIWVLCRWALVRITASLGGPSALVWTLASAFLAGALAWGMTLRPEPKVALLVIGVFACMVHFVGRPAAGPLALAALLIPLALSAHPTGILSLAPLLVTAPALARWTRHRLAQLAALGAAGAALLIVLVFVGSDVATRTEDARVQLAHGDETGVWYHEIVRYWDVRTPVQRAAVALSILALLAFLARKRGDNRTLLNLPSATIGVSLILLLATPSKLPNHLGVLLGVAAVAIAVETGRLRHRAEAGARMRALPYVVIGAAALAVAWSWWNHIPWTGFDLRTLEWDDTGLRAIAWLAASIPIVLLALVTGRELRRARGEPVVGRWSAPSWVAVAITVPAIAFTAVVLIADAGATHSWTLARQNLSTLAGDQGCGLADDVLVVRGNSIEPVRSLSRYREPPGLQVREPPVSGLGRFVLRPMGQESASTPWFALHPSSPMGIFVAGTPGPADRLSLEWGRLQAERIEPLSVDTVVRNLWYGQTSVEVAWRFLASGDLPSRPPQATAVRVGYRSTVAPRAVLAVTPPVTYENEPLVDRLRRDGTPTIVLSDLVMYFPCVRLPRLKDGIVEVPGHLVTPGSPWPIGAGTSPFEGIFDLFPVNRLSLSDTRDYVGTADVWEVDQRIPGAQQAAPTRGQRPRLGMRVELGSAQT